MWQMARSALDTVSRMGAIKAAKSYGRPTDAPAAAAALSTAVWGSRSPANSSVNDAAPAERRGVRVGAVVVASVDGAGREPLEPGVLDVDVDDCVDEVAPVPEAFDDDDDLLSEHEPSAPAT